MDDTIGQAKEKLTAAMATPFEWEKSLESPARKRNKARGAQIQEALLELSKLIGQDMTLEFAGQLPRG